MPEDRKAGVRFIMDAGFKQLNKGSLIMTHDEAVQRIGRWMKKTKQMPVVFNEFGCRMSPETPDVIAWSGDGFSTLIECKVSRSDFQADKKKSFRQYADTGMGNYRYFACPQGLISEGELPEKWGLLEIMPKIIRKKQGAIRQESSKHHETVLLLASIRRLELSTAVFVRQDYDFYS